MSQPVQVVCGRCSATNRVPAERLSDGPVCGKCRTGLFTGKPVDLHAGNFKKFLSQIDLPVVVDFWAPWCGPCKAMAPAYAKAAGELEPGMILTKLDTEANQQLAGAYNIRSIPTMIVFQKGKEVDRVSGALPLAKLKSWLSRFSVEIDGVKP